MKDVLVFAATNCSKTVLKQSSSGGVFYCLAKHFLSQLHGVVYGAVFECNCVVHRRIDCIDKLPLLLKSKYVFSDLKNTFSECEKDLGDKKNVLFVGTPCQIVGLHNYLDKKGIRKDNLVTADLFCKGAPKKEYWILYIKELFGSSAIDLYTDFRFKKESWEDYYLSISSDKKQYLASRHNDPYMRLFIDNYILMEGCYSCRYKGENRKSDITLGDFWGINSYYPEKCNKNGTSLIVLRSRQDFLLSILKKECILSTVDYYLSLRSNPSYFYSPVKPNDCIEIREQIKTSGFYSVFPKNEKIVRQKLRKPSIVKRVVKKVILKHLVDIKSNEIGIITDYGYWNFGNRLQNYALRKTLEKMGYPSINIVIDAALHYRFVPTVRKFKEKILKGKDFYRKQAIYNASLKCGEKTIPFSYCQRDKDQISRFNNIILGSDQIWNTDFKKADLPFYLGLFGVEKNTNIFSYAASFGVDTIPIDTFGLFQEAFEKMANIGVRESQGKGIVEKLGFACTQNVDPVMLLTKEEWDQAIKDYSNLKPPVQEYCLKYFLNYKDDYQVNIKTIDMMDKNSKYYIANQFDFINLIKHSSLIITDSFHAFVFALLYKKKIILFPRDSMKSRLLSLCQLIHIPYENGVVIDLNNVNLDELGSFISFSKEYLLKSLKK